MAQQKQFGFTLMELMITVTVLGVLAAIALPSFQSIIEKRRLVGAADNLFSSLQYARSEAIKQNKIVTFQFSTGADWCYGIDDDTSSVCNCTLGAGASNCTVVAGENAGVDVSVEKLFTASSYQGVEIVAASTTIVSPFTFDPRQGMPTSSGNFVLNINGQSKTVSVNTVGRIKVN